VYQVAWAADSRFLASASRDATCKVWNTRLGGAAGPAAKPVALHTLAGHADEDFALDWSPRGDALATGSRDRTLRVWRH
jgi:ribosome assembly protein 4